MRSRLTWMVLYASVPAIGPIPLRYRLSGSYSLSLVCSVPLPVGLAGFAGMGSISLSIGSSKVSASSGTGRIAQLPLLGTGFFTSGLISVREMYGIRGMRSHFRLMSYCQLIFIMKLSYSY